MHKSRDGESGSNWLTQVHLCVYVCDLVLTKWRLCDQYAIFFFFSWHTLHERCHVHNGLPVLQNSCLFPCKGEASIARQLHVTKYNWAFLLVDFLLVDFYWSTSHWSTTGLVDQITGNWQCEYYDVAHITVDCITCYCMSLLTYIDRSNTETTKTWHRVANVSPVLYRIEPHR